MTNFLLRIMSVVAFQIILSSSLYVNNKLKTNPTLKMIASPNNNSNNNKYFNFETTKTKIISSLPLNSRTTTTSNLGKIDLLYDSECPICQMEVDFLKKRDIEQHIKFTDISSSDYNPADHGNVKFEDGKYTCIY